MAGRARGKGRALLINSGLMLAALVVFFGGAELILRLFHLAPSRALRSAEIGTLERIPGIYEPGQEFTDRVRRDLPARIRINNLGFRGPDLPVARRPGTFRILVLGDSYTFGDHVDDEQAYPARLQAILSGPGAERAVEVINAGVNGFGILDESELWEKAGKLLQPDLVVLTFSPNDISDMTRPTPIIRQMKGHAELKGRFLVGPAIRFLQKTALFNGLQILAARARIAAGGHDALPQAEPSRAGPDRAPEAWQAYRAALVDLGRRLAEAGQPGILLHYPSYDIVRGADAAHAARLLPEWSREAGLEYLDLLPAFRADPGPGEALYLVPRDSHPSPRGHQLAAETVAAELKALGLLRDRDEEQPA